MQTLIDPLPELVYVVVFAFAALGCLAAVPRFRSIEDRDTRRGLVALLLTSGAWATSHVGLLLAPTRTLKLVWYVIGLILGVVAVGAWLYFCSAYTGRTHHRNPTFRRLAVGVFLAIVAVKLTNPLHGQYFSARLVETPFPHLAVQTGPLHWAAMGLSYALAFVGYFMLVELFTEIDLDTRPLLVLVSVTGLPVLADIVGVHTNLLVDMTYEPVGVAVFAIGVGFAYHSQFDSVRLAAERDTAVVALDTAGNVRDANRAARKLFPAIETGMGDPIETALPEVAERLDGEDPIIEIRRDGSVQFLRVTVSPYGAANASLGRTIVLTDVTERERYRRDLERQNDRLERFAGVISHDLRNPLSIARSRADFLRERSDLTGEDTETLDRALERMETIIEETLTLAREGRPVEQWDAVSLSMLAEDCWAMVETTDARLVVEGDLTFLADPSRLRRVFENLFRNAVEHATVPDRPGGPTVRVGPLTDRSGFYVEDDGSGIPASDRESVFETGYTSSEDGTGFGLAIVSEAVAAHRWDIEVTESSTGGTRFEVVGVGTVA